MQSVSVAGSWGDTALGIPELTRIARQSIAGRLEAAEPDRPKRRSAIGSARSGVGEMAGGGARAETRTGTP